MAAPGAFMGAHLLMDRAYEGDSTRRLAESFGLTPVVPPKRNRTDPWDYDRQAHKGRNMVERVFRPHEAPPQGRHPPRQARRDLPRQPPAHPHRHPTQKHQQNQLA